jgi:hypothetical protein
MTTVLGPFAFDGLDLFRDGLAARSHFHPAIERRDNVGGRHLLAVVELDAGAQRNRVDETVLRDVGQSLREHRHHVGVRVIRVEELVHVLHDRADEVGGRCHRVERLRLADHRKIRGAAFLRCGLRRRKRHDSENRDACPREHARERARVTGWDSMTTRNDATHDASFSW